MEEIRKYGRNILKFSQSLGIDSSLRNFPRADLNLKMSNNSSLNGDNREFIFAADCTPVFGDCPNRVSCRMRSAERCPHDTASCACNKSFNDFNSAANKYDD
jgi:hypothetical protein